MTRMLRDLIKKWELEMGFTVRTLDSASRGKPVNRVAAFQIAKAVGCTDEEAAAIADHQTASSEDEKAESA